jgi:hypothetical protein
LSAGQKSGSHAKKLNANKCDVVAAFVCNGRRFLCWHTIPLSCSSSRVARFVFVQTYQNGKKYTKWPQTIPNGHKLYQMAVNYSKL